MWIYNTSNGNLSRKGELIDKGYSGHGPGINNPLLEDQPDVGPLPRGTYTIGPAYTDPESGPLTMRLTPDPDTNDFGRSGFKIHGDLIGEVGMELASLGCLIFQHSTRLLISTSGDTKLAAI